MGHAFECAGCRHIKTEAVPYYGSGLMCESCRRSLMPPPPPLRNPNAPVMPSAGSLWVGLVFLIGVAVGAKMAGGW